MGGESAGDFPPVFSLLETSKNDLKQMAFFVQNVPKMGVMFFMHFLKP